MTRLTKREIRCHKAFVQVAPNVNNFTVYIVLYDGFSNFSIVTCNNCGELFVIDWGNPLTYRLTLKDITKSINCPTCSFNLEHTIRAYPQHIVLSNGQVGTFDIQNFAPDNSEIINKEFYEIIPGN